jgi:VWFA-related protein
MTRLLVPLLCACVLEAQDAPPTFRSGTREILVDAVVRDKGGKVVHGLGIGDFELLEDGIPQKILSVRESSAATAASVEQTRQAAVAPQLPGATRRVSDPLQRLSLVALVFDQIGPEGRRLARQTALDVLKSESEPNTHFGVFIIQNNLAVLQNYTSDRNLLRQAVERATGGAKLDLATSATGMRSVIVGTTDPVGGALGGTALSIGGGGSGAVGTTGDGAQLASEQAARIMADMNQLADNSSRDQAGRASTYSLLAIVDGLRKAPGRKTVLYFAEGLQLPNSVWHVLQSVISAANRANVTFYSVDVRGLMTTRDSAAALAMLNGANANSGALYNSTAGDRPVTRVESMATDTGLDALKANPQMAMMELAESTGGFLAANTNDLRVPLRRALQEMSTYYEVIYRPANNLYDGKYRNIAIRPKRPGLTVRAREGYFAFPPEQDHALFPYELPLLQALAEKPAPRDVQYRASVLRFRPSPDGVQMALVVQAPLDRLTFKDEEKGKRFRTHISTVSLLKDQQGAVAAKLARDLPLEIPAERMAEFTRGEFIVMQGVNAAPGHYVLESAVADRVGGKIGARRTSVVVPEKSGGVQLSSLTLVRRVDKSAETDLTDPFQVTGGRVVPWLTDIVERQPDRPMVVYFVVYPMDLPDHKPKLTIEILADQVPVAISKPNLPEPLDDGTIRYVASAPSEKLAPGLYEIRVGVEQAGTQARESITVTIK